MSHSRSPNARCSWRRARCASPVRRPSCSSATTSCARCSWAQSAADVLALSVSPQILLVGALTGLAYAVLAVGLVLVYRATRVINFAHGEIGAFGAAVLAKLVLDYGWNFWLALLVTTTLGGAIGAVIDLAVVRRLFRTPRLVLLVATIRVAQVMLVDQAVMPSPDKPSQYPTPLHGTLKVG